jgi:tripartite-type tricarboxylate transporter receptor subunit TctC
LSKRAGIKMQHIPYKGGAPAMTAVISGEVQFTMLAPNVIFPHIEAGTIRPIASGDVTRHPRLPDVPTLAEEGFPDIRAIQWVGMFTTAGTPKPMLDRLNTELNRIVRLPDVIEKLKQQGVTATGSTQEEFAKLIATEIKNWTEIAHEANIKID